MSKKAATFFVLAMGLIFYGAFGSPVNASQSLQMATMARGIDSIELTDDSSALSALYPNMTAVDPCDVDFNDSGAVDVGDIMFVADCWRSTDPECEPYNLDGDDDIDIVDIMLVAAQWGNPCSVLPFAVDMSGLYTDADMRDLAVAAGFRFVRIWVHWSSIEPNEPAANGQHTYNWPDSLFDIFRNDRRLVPLVILSAPNPDWAAVDYDSRRCGPIKDEHLDNGNFYDFVFNLVSRYADVTPYWVFYNEQDQWTDHSGGNAGGCWGGHGDLYAQMLAEAWDAAHSADPNAQVIFGAVAYEPVWDGGSTWDWLFFQDAFAYMQGHPDHYMDIILANQYDFRRDDWDGGSSTLPQNQGIIAKFHQAVSDSSFNPPGAYSIDRWQSEYGLDKLLGCGETGLQVGETGKDENENTNDLQARRVVHLNVRGLAAGLKFITWYTLVDKPTDSFKYGLVRSDLTPRPAYYAYQVLTQQLNGYVFDQQLVSGNSMIQAYRFDKDGVKKLVLWRDSGESIKSQSSTATETMTVSATELGTWTGQVRVTDKLGNSIIYNHPSSVSLTFSSDPIYVEAVQ